MVSRRNVGLSLIELLIAISIVAALSGGAYMAYSEYIREARIVVAQATMRKIVEALQAYNADHPRPYTHSDASHLLGRYLNELPLDPWGNEYIIDFFFGRVISAGEDFRLDTLSPFHPYHTTERTEVISDDIVLEYEQVGKIAFLRAGVLTVMDADGRRSSFIASGVRSGSMVANGSLLLYVTSAGVGRFVSLAGDSFIEEDLTLLPSLSFASASWDGREIAWSSDAVRYAVICDPARSVVMIGSTKGVTDPFVACRLLPPLRFNDVAFSGDGRNLLLTIHGNGTLEKQLHVAMAAAGSTVTTFADLSAWTPGNALRHVSWSKDGRYVACSNGEKSVVLRASTGSRLTLPDGSDLEYLGCVWPTFSPNSRKIAMFKNAGSPANRIVGSSLLVEFDLDVQLDDFDGIQPMSHIWWD